MGLDKHAVMISCVFLRCVLVLLLENTSPSWTVLRDALAPIVGEEPWSKG